MVMTNKQKWQQFLLLKMTGKLKAIKQKQNTVPKLKKKKKND
jgi:hypothetical protein